MKVGWKTRDLGNVCQIIGGGTPSKDRIDYYSGDIPWATVRDMRQEIIDIIQVEAPSFYNFCQEIIAHLVNIIAQKLYILAQSK